jgi:hypothetical protein
VEHTRADGSSQNAFNLEVKWALPLAAGWSIGVDLQPGWASHQRPRYAGTQLVALASWAPREDLALHFNAGRDFVHRGADSGRGGASIEWSPAARWWLVGERYLEQRTHFARAGVRWMASERWTLDASRTQRIAGPLPSNWTFGATFAFGD